ncbi:proteasome assembly chaperone family protein [Halovenus salina]|uniref:Proteasome assembly chaperone family protein n=1 Tax=Halovenus salina TaxID=1510225 RepID=A0ABD5W440_9EURY|nr:PAC2 family protein [Halovenus salina]
MAHIETHTDLGLTEPILVEGLPGVGLVGKIAADHLVETFDMTYYASCHCDGLPRVAVYSDGEQEVRPPVRIYGDEERNLFVLQSDVPVSPQAAPEFADCLTGWFAEENATPVLLSGLPEEKDGRPELYGMGCGDGLDMLDTHEIPTPTENGMVTGPTGALFAEACEQGMDAVGLVVQANRQFPDPESARVILVDAIEPFADIEISTDKLVDQAEEIASAREKLAKQMNQANEESTQAQPLGMYQ